MSLRAVIYCRCSTEEESQVHALHQQIAEAKQVVFQNGWQLVEQYVELKSGTTIQGRTEYVRLFEDLAEDRFEFIVIKSQDRLMRNVKDWYLFLDRMLTNGKKLYLYIERKFYTAEDSLITGIKAILAEDYSRELSKKINNAHRNRQQNGGKVILTSNTFGFQKMPDGEIVIDAEEAEIIQKIYQYSAMGYGTRKIEKILIEDGYKKKQGNYLSSVSIRRIIRNPLYKGTAIMNQKHYEFETKKIIINPQNEWKIWKGAVSAIVNELLWEKANQEMDRRSTKNVIRKKSDTISSQKNGKSKLSGKLICGICGKTYYQRKKKGSKEKQKLTVWQCSTYIQYGRGEIGDKGKQKTLKGCENQEIQEEIVCEIILQAFSMDASNKKEQIQLYKKFYKIIEKILENSQYCQKKKRLEKEMKQICVQKEILIEKLLEEVIKDKDYQNMERKFTKKQQELNHELEVLSSMKEEQNNKKRMEQIRKWLEQGGMQKAIVYELLKQINKIVLYPNMVEIYSTHLEKICLPRPYMSNTERGRAQDREEILKLIRENPKITLKMLQKKMGRTRAVIQNRREELKKEGFIQYEGSGGHGKWKIIKTMNEEEGDEKISVCIHS